MAHCNEFSGGAFVTTGRRTTTAPQSGAVRPTVQFPPAVLKSLVAAREADMAHASALRLREGSNRRVQDRAPTNLQQQFGSEPGRNETTRPPARRAGHVPKSTKPDLQIYRPPPARAMASNGVTVTRVVEQRKVFECTSSASVNGASWTVATSQQYSEATTSLAIQAPPKSSSMETESPARLHERHQETSSSHATMSVVKSSCSSQYLSHRRKESGPAQPPSHNLDILRKAEHDPDSLTFAEAETLANAICRKVTEDTGSAKHAASFCSSVAASQKVRPSVFLESLVCTCHEWFKRRDVMLPECNGRQQRECPLGETPASSRWTAFVEFVAELLVSVAETADRSQVLCLAELLIDCCHAALSSQARNKEDQMECMCRTLHRAGEVAEKAAPMRMGALVSRLLTEFMHGDVSVLARLILLELLELRASGWEFEAAQHLYYQDRRATICRQ